MLKLNYTDRLFFGTTWTWMMQIQKYSKIIEHFDVLGRTRGLSLLKKHQWDENRIQIYEFQISGCVWV